MTVQDLITSAMRSLGVIAAEETPNTSELTDGMLAANDILGSWSAQIMPITPLGIDTFVLNGAASYTFGPGGSGLTTRPVKIETIAVVTTGGARKPVHLASAEEWAQLADTSATGIFADNAYYDAAYPTGKLYLLPKPSAGNCELSTYKQLAPFAALGDVINLAPGYTRALRFALALDLAPEFGRPVTPELLQLGNDAKVSITGLNQAILGRPGTVEPATVAPPPMQAA